MKRLYCLLAVLQFVAFGFSAGNVVAQDYPSRAVRVVVPVSPGGSLDLNARLIGQRLAEVWKQPVVIDNRPGAGEIIGANIVAKAAPDGYTILVSSSLSTAAIHRKLPYDPAKDFAAVTQLIASPHVLVVGPKMTVGSIEKLIALVKSKPGHLKYGHAGIGSNLYLEMEQFKLSAKIEGLPDVPYKGAAPVINALLAGEVDMAMMPLSMVLAHVKAGRFRALGVLGTGRAAALPDVPTLSEAGSIKVEMDNWHGLFVPAKTPRDIVELIHREVVKALNMPDVRDRIVAMGQGIVGSTPEEFEAKYQAELVTFARIIKEARVPLQD